MSEKQVLLLGASGFLGRHARVVLENHYGLDAIHASSSREANLTDRAAVSSLFERVKPRVVVHLAGRVGGIALNSRVGAELLHSNALMALHVFHECAWRGVQRLLYTASGCVYPAHARTPIDETQLWEGYPQAENAPYSIAKRLGMVASEAYRKQSGLDSVVIVPGNLYGEYDNFRPGDSHVVAALVRRFHEAQMQNKPEVVLWGSGKPIRDFTYAGDVANVLPYFLEHYKGTEPVNVSTGRGTTIRALAEMIARLTGFSGKLVWDETKPDGQLEKVFSTARLESLGLACATTLESGLGHTIAWFREHVGDQSDGIRL